MNIQSDSYENKHQKCKGCKLFYGSQVFKGFCSSCYKKQQGTTKLQDEKVKADTIDAKVTEPIKQEAQKVQQPPQKDRSRCHDCSRKVGMLGIECKCGLMFCSKHRMPQDHKCTFDFLSQGTKNLQKNLVKISHGKIDKME